MAFSGGLFGSDKWLTDYENCDRLAREILEKLEERDRQVKNGRNFSQANVAIRPLLKKLDGDLGELRQNLIRMSASSQITSMEGERRQVMLDNLVSKLAALESSFNGKRAVDFQERTNLLGDDFSRTRSDARTLSGAEYSDVEDFSVADMRQQQQRVIQKQDEGLEALSAVIQRQKHMAYAIGNEADLQNEIIDDITDHVDRTRDRLIRETKHVEIVTRKSGTCWYWTVILLLLVAIIVIVSIPFK